MTEPTLQIEGQGKYEGKDKGNQGATQHPWAVEGRTADELAPLQAQRAVAELAGLRWQERGPPSPEQSGPSVWRGNRQRALREPRRPLPEVVRCARQVWPTRRQEQGQGRGAEGQGRQRRLPQLLARLVRGPRSAPTVRVGDACALRRDGRLAMATTSVVSPTVSQPLRLCLNLCVPCCANNLLVTMTHSHNNLPIAIIAYWHNGLPIANVAHARGERSSKRYHCACAPYVGDTSGQPTATGVVSNEASVLCNSGHNKPSGRRGDR